MCLAANIVVDGGEIDLLMQSSVNLQDVLSVGEVCIVEVKGRQRESEWNEEVLTPTKKKRWRLAAQHVLWRLEDGEWRTSSSITGVQFVLVRIQNKTVDVNWHAIDLDLG